MHYDLTIQGWMSEEELRWLYSMASKMTSVVEVGCWKGRSTYALLSGCPGPVYAVDHWLGSSAERETTHKEVASEDIYAQFMANVGGFDNLHVVRGVSVEAARYARNVDMVFIDGGHTYEEVVADLRAWKGKALKLICGHDINFEGVERAVAEELGEVQYGPGALWCKMIEKEPSLIVCIPGTNWSRAWLQGWNELYSRLLVEYGNRVQVVYASGNNIYEVRCTAAATVARLSAGNPPKHVLWIDSDNVVTADGFFVLRHVLDNMLEASAVGAWYLMEPMDGGQPEITAGRGSRRPTITDIQTGAGRLLEVDYIGFGFLLMKFSMLDALGIQAFNPILRDDGSFETDDVGFCLRATQQGFRLFLHSGVHSPHLKIQPIPSRKTQTVAKISQPERILTP